jgi:hypothetical protein
VTPVLPAGAVPGSCRRGAHSPHTRRPPHLAALVLGSPRLPRTGLTGTALAGPRRRRRRCPRRGVRCGTRPRRRHRLARSRPDGRHHWMRLGIRPGPRATQPCGAPLDVGRRDAGHVGARLDRDDARRNPRRGAPHRTRRPRPRPSDHRGSAHLASWLFSPPHTSGCDATARPGAAR